jgi:hypothetical protein
MQYVNLKVTVYFSPTGNQTCRVAGEICLFYSCERWGTIELCRFTGEEIKRTANAEGVLN